MRRPLATWLACTSALALGLLTAGLSAENRARGNELDELERWCETQSRQNELLRVENARREWILLDRGRAAGPNSREPSP